MVVDPYRLALKHLNLLAKALEIRYCYLVSEVPTIKVGLLNGLLLFFRVSEHMPQSADRNHCDLPRPLWLLTVITCYN